MKEMFRNLIHEEQGQDLVEYALLLGGAVLAAVGGVIALGGAIETFFQETATTVQGLPKS